MVLFRMACGFLCLVNLIQHRQEFVLVLHHFGKRYSEKFICGFIQQEAEGGIDIAHDMACSLYRGQRQR